MAACWKASPLLLFVWEKMPLKVEGEFVEKVDVCVQIVNLVVITRKENSPCMNMNDYL